MPLTMDGLGGLLLLFEPSLHKDFVGYQPFRSNYFDCLTSRLLQWPYLKSYLENGKCGERLLALSEHLYSI